MFNPQLYLDQETTNYIDQETTNYIVKAQRLKQWKGYYRKSYFLCPSVGCPFSCKELEEP